MFRWSVVGTVFAAAVLAGCGASTTTTTPPTTATTTPSGPQFDQGLVPAPQKNIPVPAKPKATKGTKGSTKKSKTVTKTKAAPSPGKPATVTVTKTVTITHVVTVVHNVRPNVPSGAQLPSTQPAHSLTRFTAPGGNVGCVLTSTTARCDVASRVWRPPNTPKNCHVAYGQGLFVGPGRAAGFVCAGDSVLDPTGTVVADGFDDHVGSVTCQVRMFGVTCFDTDGSGFSISRTGYTIF